VAYRASTLANLAKIRRNGQRPDGPVVIADNETSADWGTRNGFFVVLRRDIHEDLSAFNGLDAMFFTMWPFSKVVEFAKRLTEECRYVTMCHASGLQRTEFL
jgi:hypothetical protein